jgi:hypothetical protein
MGTARIQSPIPELAALRIFPMPSKPLKNARLLRVPPAGVIVAVDAAGNAYSTQVQGTSKTYYDLEAGRIRFTMEGLAKLGVVAAKALKAHRALVEAETVRDAKRAAAREVIGDMKKLGMKPTRAQCIKIELALGGGPRARAIIADALGADALPA